MKPQSIDNRKVPIIAARDGMPYRTPVILADSLEVMENYYRDKIQVLKEGLEQLNLLEHPQDIYFICREIAQTKSLLRKVFVKKKI